MFWSRGNRKDQLKRFRFQSAPLSTRLSPERHRQHTPRATRTRTRGGGAAFGVMNSPPRTQRTSSTARRSPGSGPRGRYKWMMAAYLWGEILADVCMTSFIFHCCAGEPPLKDVPRAPRRCPVDSRSGRGAARPASRVLRASQLEDRRPGASCWGRFKCEIRAHHC